MNAYLADMPPENREFEPVWGYKAEAFWTPTSEDVQRMEAALLDVTLSEFVREHLSEYFRQYVGFVHSGHKYIYFSAGLGATRDEFTRQMWTTGLVSTADGGETFWKVICDPVAKKCFKFSIGG